MTYPTPQQIDVATGALRAEAELWADQHERLKACGDTVLSLRVTDYRDTTIFDGFLAGYNEVSDAFAQRCEAGAVQAFAVGVRLLTVADVYAKEEEANLHAQYNLY